MNAEVLYVSLARLLEEAPNFDASDRLTPEESRWMSRAYGLLFEEGGGFALEAIEVKLAMNAVISDSWHSRGTNGRLLIAAVQRAFARAEVRAPASVQGAFISAGNVLDAMTAVGRVLASAKSVVRIVDPYMDEKALTDFAVMAESTVKLELLSDSSYVKPALGPAAARWKEQYPNERALEVRLSAPRALHDRLVVVDQAQVWTLTQSLNALAARSPASFVRVDGEASALKIAAYEAFWQAGRSLV